MFSLSLTIDLAFALTGATLNNYFIPVVDWI
jgi:hypothetical protein